ncbi:hypothetical protein [Fimbriiglobus ruber]|uniref:hypothetical protein n=1 Tax=Fimbriiglobus ruber TaxID=1908690 RepID=UPI00117BADAD|nr:hypothetical protein [Fimbriiglobus ruber]
MFEKVRVQIDPLAADNDCYNNCVAKKVRDGGEVVVGWRLTPATTSSALGPLIASLDHHAIWQSPDGELIDISPRVALKGDQLRTGIADENVEFKRDPEASFDANGRARSSKYVPLASDTFGYLQEACDWANQADKYDAAGNTGQSLYAQKRVKDFLDRHLTHFKK